MRVDRHTDSQDVVELLPASGNVEPHLLPPVSVASGELRAAAAAAAAAGTWSTVGVDAEPLAVTLPLLDGSTAVFHARWRRQHQAPATTGVEQQLRAAVIVISGTADRARAVAHSGKAGFHRALASVAPLEKSFAELALLLWSACEPRTAECPSFLRGDGPPAAVLLSGPSGVGKTASVEAMSAVLGMSTVRYTRSTHDADAAAGMDECFDTAIAEQPAVLLIDSAQLVFPARDPSDETADRPAVTRFMQRLGSMEPSQAVAVVVIAPEDVRLVDADVRAALLDHVTVPLPTRAQAHAVLSAVFRDTVRWGDDVDLASVADKCRGRSLADLTAFASFAHRFATQPESAGALPVVDTAAVTRALQCLASGSAATTAAGAPSARTLTGTPGFSALVGMESVTALLNRVLVRLTKTDPAVLRGLGLRLPRGLLLYGAPGSGKTLLARSVAVEAGLGVVELTLGHLARGEVGESERAVAAAFREAARFRPCAVFIDDADVVFRRRSDDGGGHGGIGSGVVSQLLIEIDRAAEGVILLVTSSAPERIDAALLQAGRVDHCVHVPLPPAEARVQLFKSACARFSPTDGFDWDQFGPPTRGFTPADLNSAARKAAYMVISHGSGTVTAGMLQECIESTVPSVSLAREEWYRYWGKSAAWI
eukprot:m.471596 g.471596  ORF g.471596 m.471596 type:complete len:653 (-) comp31281_c0_seq1:31-1989(-)